MFEVPAYGLRKNGLLQILSFADQVFDGLPVTNPHDVLGNNRTLIKGGSYIMSRRTDDLDSPGISLVVRSSSGKGWQEAVVNVDYRHSGVCEEPSTQNLHVPRQNDQVHLLLLEDFQLCLFRLGLAVWLHLDVMKGEIHGLAKLAKVRMVGNHANQFTTHLTSPKSESEILETMWDLGDQHSDSGPLARNGGAAIHTKVLPGHRLKCGGNPKDVRRGSRLRPFDPLKEDIFFGISMLVGMEDVPILRENPAGDLSHQARAVNTIE
jgi:hypothetical protein